MSSKRFVPSIGFVPTRRQVFNQDEALKFKELIRDAIDGYPVRIVDIDWLNDDGMLFDPTDVPRIVAKFSQMGVDALFIPHCNFGSEDAVGALAGALEKPVLLWGPRDDQPLADGSRLRDTQCGLFASSKALRRVGVPFSYIINCRLNDPQFCEGFATFLSAISVKQAFEHLIIGQIGTRPRGFWTVMANEGELLERFGIRIEPLTVSELVSMVKSIRQSNKYENRLEEEVSSIESRFNTACITTEDVRMAAALKLALSGWAESVGASAVALQCWTALQSELGIMPCFINGELTAEGLPIACETDIHGAVSAVILQAAVMHTTPPFLADLTIRHPTNDNAELLWHCGNFPWVLRDESDTRGAKLERHSLFPDNRPIVGEWKLKKGELTVCRFDGDHGEYSLLIAEGKSTDGPMTRGTYIWLEVDDWSKWERRIIYGPYIHHVAVAYARAGNVLAEACRFIPGLKADRID